MLIKTDQDVMHAGSMLIKSGDILRLVHMIEAELPWLLGKEEMVNQLKQIVRLDRPDDKDLKKAALAIWAKAEGQESRIANARRAAEKAVTWLLVAGSLGGLLYLVKSLFGLFR